MKFQVVFYKNLFRGEKVPFGVVLQTDSKLYYKFDLSKDRLKSIKEVNPDIDEATFINFEKTFKENFSITELIDISDDLGNQIQIKSTNPKFLDYLHSTYQGGFQYSEPTPIEGKKPSKYLKALFDSMVIHASFV